MRISIFLTSAEFDQVVARADQNGQRPAGYIRAAALQRLPPVIPPLNREAWANLARAAGNLNQLARRINSGDGAADIEEARHLVSELRGQLIGADLFDDPEPEVA